MIEKHKCHYIMTCAGQINGRWATVWKCPNCGSYDAHYLVSLFPPEDCRMQIDFSSLPEEIKQELLKWAGYVS